MGVFCWLAGLGYFLFVLGFFLGGRRGVLLLKLTCP